MINKDQILLIPSLLLFSLASLLISLTSGSVDISAMQMIGELFTANESLSNQILWDIRIPRSASAFITGALLAMSGVIMQVLLRNPLADPYILGI